MDDLISRKADGYNISHQAVLIIKGGGKRAKCFCYGVGKF